MAQGLGSAEVKLRGDDILVIAYGMLGAGRVTDWEACVERLNVGEPNERLGAALRACLLRSRVMPSDWMRAEMGASDYADRLANAFGVASSALYPGMKYVHVEWEAGTVRFGPTRNKRGGVFEGFESGDRQHEDVVMPFAASDAEFGAALREAFRRSL